MLAIEECDSFISIHFHINTTEDLENSVGNKLTEFLSVNKISATYILSKMKVPTENIFIKKLLSEHLIPLFCMKKIILNLKYIK